MTYQETMSTINKLNHMIQTRKLTREQSKELITQRELTWAAYKQAA